jgi:hypothetical protein
VFERLLLLRFEFQSWAKLHPGQAGFRRDYSTYGNAAVVHSLLASKARSTIVFLDFKSAFDVINHQLLYDKLAARGCPPLLLSLVESLMLTHLTSRLLINGQVTDWFDRTCGVLQGSPLSPWLFNLFVDDLLFKVNMGIAGIPICLFYADDGAIVTHSNINLQQKLEMVEDWSKQNALLLGVSKCAIITTRSGLPPLLVYGQEIPRTDSYTYLGFPVTKDGIDFPKHVEWRMQAAVGRARWLGVQSNSWGPANRLRVYKQFLAPMFEYGAPLVCAWAKENPSNQDAFDASCSSFKDLMAWISNSDGRHTITANLCGLSTLGQRFQRLKTAYQLSIDQMSPESPLKQLLEQSNAFSSLHSFSYNLGHDPDYLRFRQTSTLQPSLRTALCRFLQKELRTAVESESQNSHLTALIPFESRKVPGLPWADISLAAPASAQNRRFQYRRGHFMFNSICACDPEVRFHRGHETCPSLKSLLRLTRQQRHDREQMQLKLNLVSLFTDIDYLLNSGQLQYADLVLLDIWKKLQQVYRAKMLES